MKRLRKEGIGRIGMWVEGVSFHNPYPEIRLNSTILHIVLLFNEREFWRVRDRPNHTPRTSSDSNSKNGTKEW